MRHIDITFKGYITIYINTYIGIQHEHENLFLLGMDIEIFTWERTGYIDVLLLDLPDHRYISYI